MARQHRWNGVYINLYDQTYQLYYLNDQAVTGALTRIGSSRAAEDKCQIRSKAFVIHRPIAWHVSHAIQLNSMNKSLFFWIILFLKAIFRQKISWTIFYFWEAGWRGKAIIHGLIVFWRKFLMIHVKFQLYYIDPKINRNRVSTDFESILQRRIQSSSRTYIKVFDKSSTLKIKDNIS